MGWFSISGNCARAKEGNEILKEAKANAARNRILETGTGLRRRYGSVWRVDRATDMRSHCRRRRGPAVRCKRKNSGHQHPAAQRRVRRRMV